MNFNNLKVFVDVSETLSFSKSAQNLKIAQPAVSRSIKNFETELGVQLFIRNNRLVYLTPQGEKLKKGLGPLLQKMESILTEVIDNDVEVRGVLRVGSLVEFGEFKLLPLIKKLNKLHPRLELKVTMEGEKELREKFLEGKLDLFFGIKPMMAENIKSFKFLDQKSFLYTSVKSAGEKPENLKFVAYRENDPLILGYLKKYCPNRSYQSIDTIFTANSHKAMVDFLIHQKDCYGILPEFSVSVADAQEKGLIKGLATDFLDTPIYYSYWDNEFLPPSLKSLIDLLKQERR